MAPKRKAAATAETEELAKKYKSAMDDIATEYLCPITAELPLDPVTAEDGRIYERQAIEEHFAARAANGDPIRSPMTNEPMGRRLLPATQVKNTIEKLVRSGAIGGDKAEQWLTRLKEEELVDKHRQAAERGDTFAMSLLGNRYYKGKGVQQNFTTAFGWFAKGAEADDVGCLSWLAYLNMEGEGTSKQEVHSISLMTQAALMGSKNAAWNLGTWYYEGKLGLPVDKKRAKYWYRKVATGRVNDASQADMEKAAARVAEP